MSVWRIKDVDEDTRQRVQAAADRAGMPLSAWLEQAIMRRAGRSGTTPSHPPAEGGSTVPMQATVEAAEPTQTAPPVAVSDEMKNALNAAQRRRKRKKASRQSDAAAVAAAQDTSETSTSEAAAPVSPVQDEHPQSDTTVASTEPVDAAEIADIAAPTPPASADTATDILPQDNLHTPPEIFDEPVESEPTVTTTPRVELEASTATPPAPRARRVSPLPALATSLAVVAALGAGGYFLFGQSDDAQTGAAQTPPANSAPAPGKTAAGAPPVVPAPLPTPPIAAAPSPAPVAPPPAAPNPPQVAAAPPLPPDIPAARPGFQPSLLVPPLDDASSAPQAGAAPPGADLPTPPASPPSALDKESIATLTSRGEVGDLQAQVELGKRYMQGIGTEKNPTEALRWLQKAAEAGNGQAQFNVGVMYERGIGTTADLTKAVGWYRKAAAQPIPVPTAIHNLALLYVVGGPGVAADPVQARVLMTRSAELGLPESEYSLALMYYQGVGGAPDKIMALSWLALAARTNNPQLIQAAQQLASGMSEDEKAKAQQIANQHVQRINENIQHLRALAGANKPTAAGASPSAPDVRLDKASIAEIQKLLTALKLYTGTIDGDDGPRTVQAIRDYQNMAGLPIDGKATPELLSSLRDVAGAVTPKSK